MKSESLKAVLILAFLVFATSVMLNTAQAADLAMVDKRFLENAAQSNKTEIEGSQLAKTKTKNPDILSFAEKLIEDHTKANSELAALAKSKGVEVPNEPSIMEKGKLKYLSTRDGAGFDESFVNNIGIAAHEVTIKLFETAAKEAKDPEIKQFAQKMLPELNMHLEHAKELKAKVNKK